MNTKLALLVFLFLVAFTIGCKENEQDVSVQKIESDQPLQPPIDTTTIYGFSRNQFLIDSNKVNLNQGLSHLLPKYGVSQATVFHIASNFNDVYDFRKIKLIEKILGRKKAIKNSPRTCDIDILDFDHKMFDKTVDNSQLIVPHPRLHNRNFVLIPLFDIDKNWKHPKLKLNITKLLSKMGSNNLRSIKLI